MCGLEVLSCAVEVTFSGSDGVDIVLTDEGGSKDGDAGCLEETRDCSVNHGRFTGRVECALPEKTGGSMVGPYWICVVGRVGWRKARG